MFIDYHIHNHFSPDSEEKIENIIQKAKQIGLKEIAITNHPETHNKTTGKSSFDIDEARKRFKKIKEEIDKAQKKYPEINILFGIELEYLSHRMKNMKIFINETNFDFVLGSVHIVNKVIIASKHFAKDLYNKIDENTAYTNYFNELLKLVKWGQIDVIAHFDICKKFGYEFYGVFNPKKYKKQIIEILQLMKEKNIGLELNTKSMKKYCHEIFPHPTILKWATEIGIKNFTIGSDAHKAKDVGGYIKEAIKIAKQAKITNISTYKKRSAKLNPL